MNTVVNNKIKVLFICMGNICRSPTADGVFKSIVESQGLANRIQVDSAGTHGYHIGNSPDQRAQATASKHGIDLSSLTARKVTEQDFYDFDYIIAMDQDNLRNLQDVQQHLTSSSEASLHLLMEFSSKWNNSEVPDPYYGGDNGFEEVFQMIKNASEGLFDKIHLEL